MGETYRFYVQMDGETYGPYSAKAIRDLNLPDDIFVTEESMNCKWLPASKFDFDDMVRKEEGLPQIGLIDPSLDPLQSIQINPDGTVTNGSNWERPYNPNEVPQEIKKWNWGAFVFCWLWGLFNGVYWPLFMIITGFIPYIGPIVNLAVSIALGINGSEWSWKAKRWNSLEHFQRVQHNWAMACIWVLGGVFILGIVIAIAINL